MKQANDTGQRLVVAMLDDPNGMATWCWEAARAIQSQGRAVVLVAVPEAKLPDDPAVEVVRFRSAAPPARPAGWRARARRKLAAFSAEPVPFLPELHRFLRENGIAPTGYFLNNPRLQHPGVDVPQYVVAWAYPSSLAGYLSKIGKLSGWRSLAAVKDVTRGAISCWRNDWRGYRHGAGTMAVTERLGKQLSSRGLRNVQVVHPGTSPAAVPAFPPARPDAPVALMIAAVDLEDARKRVGWMIRALAGLPPERFRLTAAGRAGAEFQTWARRMVSGITFTGALPRERTLDLMRQHDVFLMGSCLDDWGYVVVEAMSNGLAVIASDQTPFDEIVGDAGLLYATHSPADFSRRVRALDAAAIARMKQAGAARASALFSRRAFGEALVRMLPAAP